MSLESGAGCEGEGEGVWPHSLTAGISPQEIIKDFERNYSDLVSGFLESVQSQYPPQRWWSQGGYERERERERESVCGEGVHAVSAMYACIP